MAKGSLNLPNILKHLDTNNFEVYAAYQQNEEQRKELERTLAYVLPLWMSGVANPRDQIKMTLAFNRYVNLDWWELDGHHELRAKLLAAIGVGHAVRHDFYYRESRKQTALTALLARHYPDIRKDEVRLWARCNSEAGLIELCRDYGVQKKDREVIVEEYRRIIL